MRFPKLKFALGKVIAHHADQIYRGKEAGTESGVGSRTAEQIGMLFDWCFDRVERNGTDDEEGHRGQR